MYSLIVVLPLIGFLLAALGGFYFGRDGVSLLVCVGQILTLGVVGLAVYEVIFCNAPVLVHLWDWILADGYLLSFGLWFDRLTCVMLLIIVSISVCVQVYSVGYMAHDPYVTRFMGYLSLFTFFMIVLVTADNFLQMFIGWEGVGLCSYLLINFWHKRVLANKAALKAMIINRIADVLFMLAILLILITFKTLDFLVVFQLVPLVAQEKIFFLGLVLRKIDLIGFFLLMGALGKSAQLGLHLWLPDAMEGPTPVSALLHAATMVTAGVFLIVRCSFVFEHCPNLLAFIALIGALTSWFFSITGAFQYDLKKVIAYSTCSQLGYMFFCCGLSLYNVALFHLFNHAFFKALLFLSAGSVIHALYGEQDLRRMGSLLNFLPLTYFAMVLGSLAIMGFPFLAGFYSKDLLLELASGRYLIDGAWLYFLGTSGAFFTAFYSVRFLFFVFFTETNSFRILNPIGESGWFMSGPLCLLSLLAMFSGYLGSELFLGLGGFALGAPGHGAELVEAGDLSAFLKNLPLLCSLLGLQIFFLVDYFFFERAYLFCWRQLGPFFYFAQFFNVFFNRLLLQLFGTSYKAQTKLQDKGFLEFFGPYGFYRFFLALSLALRRRGPWTLFFYLGLMVFGLGFLVLLFLVHVKVLLWMARNSGLWALALGFLVLDALADQD